MKTALSRQRFLALNFVVRLRSRPRLGQSGPLTGQQYSIHRQYALQKADANGIKTVIAPQVLAPQKLKRITWEPLRSVSRAAPDRRRLRARPWMKPRGGAKERRTHEEWGVPTILRCFRWDSSNPAPVRPAGLTVASPEPPRSTSDSRSEVLRGGSGEATVVLRVHQRTDQGWRDLL
jgi:hypothetical protein